MNKVLVYTKTNGKCWYCGRELKMGISKIGLEKIKNFNKSDNTYVYTGILIRPEDIKNEFLLSQIRDKYENAKIEKLIFEKTEDETPTFVTKYFHISDGFSIDHIKSNSTKNRNRINNVVPCCTGCNSSKGTKDIEHFRHILWEKEFEKNFGVRFNRKQKEYLEQIGVKLPLEDYVFYFEEKELLNEG